MPYCIFEIMFFFVFAFKSIKATKVVIYYLNVHIIVISTIL